jgi:serine/threonine protein kinase
MARATLQWRTPGDSQPASVIVKMRPPQGEFTELGDRMRLFAREARFYREIAPTTPTRVPKIFYVSDQPGFEIIVMEDLSWMTACDQVAGMPHDLVARTVAELAGLQARYWDNQRLASLDWIPWGWQDHLFGGLDHDAWTSFHDKWSRIIGPRGVELARRVEEHRDWIDDRMRGRPKTIVHTDLRADNVLIDESGDTPRACIIDWQLLTRGPGVYDLARLLGESDTPQDRAGHHLEVLRAWHDALIAGGVHGYSFDEAYEDMVISALIMLRVPAWMSNMRAINAPADSRAGRLFRVSVCRVIDFLHEVEAHRVLPK